MASLCWLVLALTITIEGEKITGYEPIADPSRLQHLDLAVVMIPFFAPTRDLEMIDTTNANRLHKILDAAAQLHKSIR